MVRLSGMDDPERLEILEETLASLSPFHRQLLLWNRVDGLTYGEIANRLGISNRSLERRMSRMIERWSRALERRSGSELAR
jgi:RNA polymerase sigma factor (sigma-70 family)